MRFVSEVACVLYEADPDPSWGYTSTTMDPNHCADLCATKWIQLAPLPISRNQTQSLALNTHDRKTTPMFQCLCSLQTRQRVLPLNLARCNILCPTKTENNETVAYCGGTIPNLGRIWSVYNVSTINSYFGVASRSTTTIHFWSPPTSQTGDNFMPYPSTTTAQNLPFPTQTLNGVPTTGAILPTATFLNSLGPKSLSPDIVPTRSFPTQGNSQILIPTNSVAGAFSAQALSSENTPSASPNEFPHQNNGPASRNTQFSGNTVHIVGTSNPDSNGIIETGSEQGIPLASVAPGASALSAPAQFQPSAAQSFFQTSASYSNSFTPPTSPVTLPAPRIPPGLPPSTTPTPIQTSPSSALAASPLLPVLITCTVLVVAIVGMTLYQRQIHRRRDSDRGVGGLSTLQARMDDDLAHGVDDPLTYTFDDAYDGMPSLQPVDPGAGRPKLYRTIIPGETHVFGELDGSTGAAPPLTMLSHSTLVSLPSLSSPGATNSNASRLGTVSSLSEDLGSLPDTVPYTSSTLLRRVPIDEVPPVVIPVVSASPEISSPKLASPKTSQPKNRISVFRLFSSRK